MFAFLAGLATNLSQCAWNAAGELDRAHYWRSYGRGEIINTLKGNAR